MLSSGSLACVLELHLADKTRVSKSAQLVLTRESHDELQTAPGLAGFTIYCYSLTCAVRYTQGCGSVHELLCKIRKKVDELLGRRKGVTSGVSEEDVAPIIDLANKMARKSNPLRGERIDPIGPVSEGSPLNVYVYLKTSSENILCHASPSS